MGLAFNHCVVSPVMTRVQINVCVLNLNVPIVCLGITISFSHLHRGLFRFVVSYLEAEVLLCKCVHPSLPYYYSMQRTSTE